MPAISPTGRTMYPGCQVSLGCLSDSHLTNWPDNVHRMSGLTRLSQCQPSHQLAGHCTQDVRSHSAVSVTAISPTGRTMYPGCQVSLGCLSDSHLTNWPDNVHRMSGLTRLSQCQPSHQLAGQCTQDVRSHSAVSVPASHQLAGQCTHDVRSHSAVSVTAISPTGRTMYPGCQVSLGCLSASHLTNWPDNVHRMSGLTRLSQCQPSHQLVGQCTQDVRSRSAVSVPASHQLAGQCTQDVRSHSAVSVPAISPIGRTMYPGCQVSLGCLSASHLTNWPDNVHRMSGLARLSQCQPSHQLAGQCTQDVRSHSAVSVPAISLTGRTMYTGCQVSLGCLSASHLTNWTDNVHRMSGLTRLFQCQPSHQLDGQCTQDVRSHSAVSVPAISPTGRTMYTGCQVSLGCLSASHLTNWPDNVHRMSGLTRLSQCQPSH